MADHQPAGQEDISDDVWLLPGPGRVLSYDDIAHYQEIVVALNETIRLIAETDQVIDAHGGWPDAFVTEGGEGSEEES